MLCAIYKSPKKEGMYLYIAKRGDFSAVPETLQQMFGKPELVMLFNLAGEKTLKNAKKEEVLAKIQTEGFYLQMPPPPENLLNAFLAENKEKE